MRGWYRLWVSLMGVICKKECILGGPRVRGGWAEGRGQGAERGNGWDSQGSTGCLANAIGCGQGRSLSGGTDSVMHQWQVGGTGVTTPKADVPKASQHSWWLSLNLASGSFHSRPPSSHYQSIGVGTQEVTCVPSLHQPVSPVATCVTWCHIAGQRIQAFLSRFSNGREESSVRGASQIIVLGAVS